MVYEMTDQQARECNAIENLQRENKSPLEEARDIAGLLKGGKSPKEIAAIIGRQRIRVVQERSFDAVAARGLKGMFENRLRWAAGRQGNPLGANYLAVDGELDADFTPGLFAKIRHGNAQARGTAHRY